MKKPYHLILILSLAIVFSAAASNDVPSTEKAPLLRAIRFQRLAEEGEAVIFELDQFKIPTVFGIEGKSPRVVCDFHDTAFSKDVSPVIETDGTFIRRIRIGIHPPPEAKTRAVLDLNPDLDYNIQQLFSKKAGRFSIVVQPAEQSLGQPIR